MRFSILGPLSVTGNGRDRTPSAPKHRQMLVLMLMNANRVVSMAQFVEELWDYNPPPRAVAAVHTYVMQVRRSLQSGRTSPADPERIVTRDQGYLFRVHDDELDLHTYEHRLRAGHTALDAGALDAGARHIRAAHDMWHGPVFVDAPAGPLLRAALAALEGDRLESVVRRVDAELQLGRHHQLLAELHALVHQDPTHEQLAGHLMLALYRSGRRADALTVFHRLRRALREELGTSPRPDTHHLVTDILAGHARLEPPFLPQARLSLDAAAHTPATPGRRSRARSADWPQDRPLLLGA
ncbi:BTAD domain-containing putative transcriptional regulator [Streptomyces sp. NPDC056149]|uniref:AfsR/SARP family transcriptional regulator n=1 Tax=Streptomyces sp. NPDC056149 TaxID=3345728 RepID=UPI0035DFD93E